MRHTVNMIKASRSALAIAFFVSFGPAADTSAQTPPPSLQGENLFGMEFAGPYEGVCDPDAGTFSMSFSFGGQAFGPYSGTFTESGTVTGTLTGLHPTLPGFWVATLTSFNATFEIDSLVGQVEGTKEMVEPLPG